MTPRRTSLSLLVVTAAFASSLGAGCSGEDVGTSWHSGYAGRQPNTGGVVSSAGTGNPSTGTPPTGTATSTGSPASGATGTPVGTGTVPTTNPMPTSTGTTPSSTPEAATYAVTLDKTTDAVELFANSTFTVSVAPNGYTGTVVLTASNLPSDVSSAFDKATLMLDGTTTETARLTVTTQTSTKPGDAPFNIVASSAGGGSKTAAATLTVSAVLTIHVPAGVDQNGGSQNNPVTSAFGTYPIMISAPGNMSSQTPVTIHFYNDDNVDHEIHASSPNAGFPHGNGPFSPQTLESTRRDVNQPGTYDFYLHDQGGPATVGRIIIQ